MTLERMRELDAWLQRCNEPPYPFVTRLVTKEEWEYLQVRRRGAPPAAEPKKGAS